MEQQEINNTAQPTKPFIFILKIVGCFVSLGIIFYELLIIADSDPSFERFDRLHLGSHYENLGALLFAVVLSVILMWSKPNRRQLSVITVALMVVVLILALIALVTTAQSLFHQSW